MRLSHNGEIFRISFKHGTEANEIPGVGTVDQDYTIAQIRQGDYDPNLGADNIMSTAKVRRFYKDERKPETARKEALKTALDKMNATRSFRTAVWNAYHNRPGGIYNAMNRAEVVRKLAYSAG